MTTVLSLYSGVGGMDLGAHYAGLETVAMCEADPWNRSILNRHWPGVPVYESDEQVTIESLRALGIEHVDIVAGGPPCQPFSVAGKQAGVVDPRHRWPQMARIVDELRPAYVVVENVAGFSDVAEQLVRADLESLGYRTVRFDVPAASVGAPHKRERIFVVGYADCAREDTRSEEGASRHPTGESGGRAVAHAYDLRESQPEGCLRNERGRSGDGSSGTVADSDSAGRGERRGAESVRAELAPVERSGDDWMGDTSERGLRRWPASRQSGQPPFANEGSRTAGTPEPRLGRDAGRTPDRMDTLRWPAPRGAAQHGWEPPRVTSEKHERRKRLKALGNICVPWQVYPIFAAIAESMRERVA
jgi:DNA (cytosine-5)-methyltransferase 1